MVMAAEVATEVAAAVTGEAEAMEVAGAKSNTFLKHSDTWQQTVGTLGKLQHNIYFPVLWLR